MAPPSTDDVQPNEGERRNGWTAASLAQYLAERERQKLTFAKDLDERGARDARAVTTQAFNPHDW